MDSLCSNSNKDSTLIMSSNVDKCDRSIMIMCGPNGSFYELFAYSNRWIDYYVDYGINVFLWNYRGYGDRKGFVDFLNMQTDVECIAEFLKNKYKNCKIGVHGISIGGIPASYLAR